MGKRCDKGKSCGATCIERLDACLIDAAPALNQSLKSAKKGIQRQQSQPYTLATLVKKQYSNSVGGQVRAKGILNGLQQEGSSDKKNGLVKEKEVNWRAVLGVGVDYVGGGDYGSFMTVSSSNLLGGKRDGIPNRVGVKAGRIGENEIAALKLAGANDMGPKLIAARLSKRVERDQGGNALFSGVIAMTKVPAIPYKRVPDVWGDMGSKSDMYWRAMANLHRLGIAHNDMHGGNVFIDSRGKGRFVDFGLAQLSRKAALAEALGSLNWENWQFSASQSQGLAKIAKANLTNVENILLKKGFSRDEISEIMEAGIRNKDDYYQQGAWGRMTNRDAKQLIEAFYKGIG